MLKRVSSHPRDQNVLLWFTLPPRCPPTQLGLFINRFLSHSLSLPLIDYLLSHKIEGRWKVSKRGTERKTLIIQQVFTASCFSPIVSASLFRNLYLLTFSFPFFEWVGRRLEEKFVLVAWHEAGVGSMKIAQFAAFECQISRTAFPPSLPLFINFQQPLYHWLACGVHIESIVDVVSGWYYLVLIPTPH